MKRIILLILLFTYAFLMSEIQVDQGKNEWRVYRLGESRYLFFSIEEGLVKIGNTNATADLEVSKDLTVTGDATIGDDLTVTDDVVVGDDLTVTDDAIVGGIIQSASYNFCSTVGGTADAITLDFTPDLAALAAGLRVTFVADSANTGVTTLAIDGGTAKNIYEASDVSALEANDIRAGMVVDLIYDGTQWQQVSQSGN